jgi:DNA alkylation damage repair protein AlkB
MLLRNFLPAQVQTALVVRLLGRDLKNPEHRTNLHIHYDITYPREEQTFLGLDKQMVAFKAKLPVHRDLTMDEVFRRKLRWILLGGQYDWTEKRYPDEAPPPFPPDIGDLVQGMFPSIEPEAAIINVYSPGDTLGLHRDVSEKVSRPLVSISIGCDALFIVGNDEPNAFHIIPLQSGDVVYMADEARYAWHGVPRIIAGTCPEYLQSLPDAGHWENFMADKRINLNIRQMF